MSARPDVLETVTKDQLRGARERVIRTLERRWAPQLGGGPLPDALKKAMLHHDGYRKLVEMVLRSDTIRLPSLANLGPVLLHERMLEELGGDPSEYFCDDCHAEIPKGQVRCRPCAEWRKTGVR